MQVTMEPQPDCKRRRQSHPGHVNLEIADTLTVTRIRPSNASRRDLPMPSSTSGETHSDCIRRNGLKSRDRKAADTDGCGNGSEEENIPDYEDMWNTSSACIPNPARVSR
jgi:hypothetical protein